MAFERANKGDRRLYLWVAVVFPLVVLAGFARTYYLKGFFDTPPIPGLLVHIHGIVMTSWVVLFVTQIVLVANRRTKLHQRLGVWGAILALLVFCVGILTAIAGAARGSTPGPPALQFLVVPIFDMVVFAILVGAALYYRRRLEMHKRLMLLASLSLLSAAFARIPLDFVLTGGPLAFFGLTDLFVIVCVAADTIRNRRLHPAFVWGTLLIICSQPLRIMLSGTNLWNTFASWLVGFVK
jgi:hypothetical protein